MANPGPRVDLHRDRAWVLAEGGNSFEGERPLQEARVECLVQHAMSAACFPVVGEQVYCSACACWRGKRQTLNNQPLNLSGRLAGVHCTIVSTCFLFVTFNNKKWGGLKR